MPEHLRSPTSIRHLNPTLDQLRGSPNHPLESPHGHPTIRNFTDRTTSPSLSHWTTDSSDRSQDKDGQRHECVAESFTQAYQVFILIHAVNTLPTSIAVLHMVRHHFANG